MSYRVSMNECPKLYLLFEYPKTSLKDVSSICNFYGELSEIEKFILEVAISFDGDDSEIMAYLIPEGIDGDWGCGYEVTDSEENIAAVNEYAIMGMSKLLTKVLNAFCLD